MPGLTAAARNVMLQALREEATHFSLHTDDPGTTGANEVSGGGYAKQEVTTASFNDPTAGEMTLAGDIEFDGTADSSVTYLGIWEGTNFLGGKALTGDTVFNSQGKYLVKDTTKFELVNVTP